ncbi:hypothetical protein D3C85_1435140 [compost metagenome]
MIPFIFCAPWLMPMANTRKGTRTEYGSSSKPIRATSPNCQITATSEQATTRKVLRMHRVYQYNTAAVMMMAMAKKLRICCMPDSRSPTTLAKPVM